MILPCIVCNKALDSAIPAHIESENQPNEGTVFTSRGNYGSTVWDPMSDSTIIEITVCDECLVKHKNRVLQGAITRRTEIKYEPWEPYDQVP